MLHIAFSECVFTEPKNTECPRKKKKARPVADPAKTSLILFDEVNLLYLRTALCFLCSAFCATLAIQ